MSSSLSQRYHLIPREIEDVLVLLRLMAIIATVRELPRIHLNDPADLMVLATAIESDAAFLVTGDRELLALHQHGSVKIATAAQFLKVI